MTVLRGRRLGGHPQSVTIPTGTSPSQVGSLSAGTPATTTFSVTYTAATGTAPIGYAGQTSTDGGATWQGNGGTFTATGGTFTGLSSSTIYKWEIVATNGFGSSITVYGGTVVTSAAAATTFSGSISPNSGLSGSTFSYTLTPDGGQPWPSGEVITPSVSGGNASPSSAAGVGHSPVTFTVTVTGAGGTNCIVNASAPGMTNSTGAEQFAISVPVGGGGGSAPATLTMGAVQMLTSRDANASTGNPPGFSSTFNKGWATIKFPITSSAAVSGTPLLMRLRDRDNPGTTVVDWTPTGTNALASGSNTVAVTVPAADYMYLADFGFSGSQNTYATTPGAFAPAYIVLYGGQSICTNMLGTIAGSNGGDIAGSMTFNNKTFYFSSGSNLPQHTWVTAGDNSSSFYSLSAEGLNLTHAEQGIPVGFIDSSRTGTSLNAFDLEAAAYDGNSVVEALGVTGMNVNTDGNTGGHLFHMVSPGRIDALCWDGNNNATDNEHPDFFASMAGSLYCDIVELVDKPFIYIPTVNDYTQGASSNLLDARVDDQVVQHVPNAHSFWEHQWPGPSPNGHPGEPYKLYHARNWFTARRVAAGISPEAPKVISATRAAGSSDIYVTLSNHGSSLTGWHAVSGSTPTALTVTADASAVLLGQLFSLAAPGSLGLSNSQTTSIQATSATIINATTVKVTFPDTLSGRSLSADSDYDLLVDVFGCNSSFDVPSIRDDIIEPGMSYGRAMQCSLHPVYVPKPSLPSSAIAIQTIDGLSSGISVVAGALANIVGTWTGSAAPTGIEISVDGGSYNKSADARINTDGTWRAAFVAPGTIASHALAVRMLGTSTVSGSTSFTTVANDTTANTVMDLDIRRLSNTFSDRAKTVAANHLDRLNSYADPTGNGADLAPYTNNVGQRIFRNNALGMPALHCRSGYYGYHNGYPQPFYSYLACPNLPALLTSPSFTVFFTALKPNGGAGTVFYGTGAQTITVGIGTGANCSFNGTNIDTGTDLSRKIVHAVARFDASAGSFKIKTANEAEVSGSGYSSSQSARGWNEVDVGYGGNCAIDALIYRVGVVNRLWSDAERDAYLAQSLRRYGV